jgi:glutaredoxin
MMNVLVYSKENCAFCVRAKKLLEQNSIDYEELIIGRDIDRDKFISMFPEVKTVPHIIIDNNTIGGFTQLEEWFKNGN